MISDDLLRRVGETEYAGVDPRYVVETRFGDFFSHPDFPDRYDANQLIRVRCSPAEVPDVLRELEVLYGSSGVGYRKMSGYAPGVWDALDPALTERGWGVWTNRVMLDREDARRPVNPDVQVSAVRPSSPDLESFYRADGTLDRGFELARSQATRVGGEYLVGYLDGRPAGCTGWFVRDGVARFRHVFTEPGARGSGVATTLIRHVQEHPEVVACDDLAILVGRGGPAELYEQLGFREVMRFWEAKTPGQEAGS